MADIPFIFLNLLVAFLNLPPLLHNAYQNNSGVASLGFWNFWIPLQSGINAILWRDDVLDRAPAWCDITSKLYIGGAVGGVAAPLCIARFLAKVVSPNAVAITPHDRRRRAFFDYGLCFGLPAVAMGAHYMWQPARYGIMQAYGCQYTGINVWPMHILYLIWPPLLSGIACIYAVYVLYRLYCHRRDWKKLVTASGSALTPQRFLRLCGLCSLYAFLMLPLSIFAFVSLQNAFGPSVPYDWGWIHFWEPAVYITPGITRVPFLSWTPTICSAIVVLFFGLSSDSRSAYGSLARITGLSALARLCGPVRFVPSSALKSPSPSEKFTHLSADMESNTILDRKTSSSCAHESPPMH